MDAEPFLSFYTPTYKRPTLLARCKASVEAQTVSCQHVIIPDEIGIGIDGVFRAVPTHAHLVTGRYVHFLADDDFLASPTVALQVEDFIHEWNFPDVVIVRAIKNGLPLPFPSSGPPVQGQIDLGCVITRRDIWGQHVHDYGSRYEGDFDHVSAMWHAGRRFAYSDILFELGPAMRGRPE